MFMTVWGLLCPWACLSFLQALASLLVNEQVIHYSPSFQVQA